MRGATELIRLSNKRPVFLLGISPPEFDNLTLAVIRGRLVRYLMRSKEVLNKQFIYCF